MLIAYWYHRPDARRGARMAAIVTVGGGLALLLGVLGLGAVAGSYDLEAVLAAGDVIRGHHWYPALLGLILLGVLTKSAQFPFHFWLPHAMAAPTPVSAYLHSATMVKAGVFLLARLWPAFAGTDLWILLVCGAGAASMLLGTFAATYQRDMKGVLAYSTIGHLGLITFLLGMSTELALVAAVFHMLNHATFKASLFMATGVVDHETGTRDLGRLNGLRHAMPITATLAAVAAAAMAGVPLLNGFLSKEMFFEESIVVGGSIGMQIALPAIATLGGLFSVAYSLRFIHEVFFGPPARDLRRVPHDPRPMLVPSALLVVTCVLVGVLPGQTIGPLLATAGTAILGDVPEYELAVWHGFTPALLMSVVALAGGVSFYWMLHRRGQTLIPTPVLSRFDSKRMFDIANVAATRAAARAARWLFSRRLQTQLVLIVASACVAVALPLSTGGWLALRPAIAPLDPVFAALWIVGVACAIGAAWQAKFHRLAALVMLGGAGLVVCLTFAWLSAPDLALTQIAVEVVTMVLFLLGLRWMPRRVERSDARRRSARAKARRARDAVLAAIAGIGMGTLAFAVVTLPPAGLLAPFFFANALDPAGGRNVVNLILVDFRGLDTLGEITVVGSVAVTVYALLRRFRPAPESIEVPKAQAAEAATGTFAALPSDVLPANHMRLPAVLVRLLLPMAALVSIYFLLRGHNAPGGGFVGGLVMATAIIAQYMVSGTIWVEARLRAHPQVWIALGLLASTAAGFGAWLASRAFLTALALDLHLPLIGDVHVSSVLVFDLGVYVLVVGATALMLVALAHQSLRSPRRVVTPLPETEDAERGEAMI
jgi:multicomponent K+:H+ antiporter subunit A